MFKNNKNLFSFASCVILVEVKGIFFANTKKLGKLFFERHKADTYKPLDSYRRVDEDSARIIEIGRIFAEIRPGLASANS
jgi:hypothetical protein